MSRSVLIVLLAVVALALSATIALAQGGVTISTDQPVNIRSGPGTEYTVRGVLKAGGSLNVTGRNNFDTSRECEGTAADRDMWLRVQFQQVEGWVARCNVTLNGSITDVRFGLPTNPVKIAGDDLPRITGPEYLDPDRFSGTISENATLRTGPGVRFEALGVIPAGWPVYVTGRNARGGWVFIEIGEKTGWVARQMLILSNDWAEKTPVKE